MNERKKELIVLYHCHLRQQWRRAPPPPSTLALADPPVHTPAAEVPSGSRPCPKSQIYPIIQEHDRIITFMIIT